ncbi:MAG: hypothetical protein ACJ8C4_08070 [Gemmataceae bacterium]
MPFDLGGPAINVMNYMYFHLAFVGFVGSIMMFMVGLDLHWQGLASLVVGSFSLGMGIRSLRMEKKTPVDWDAYFDAHCADPDFEMPGPYTPADFPCPDSRLGMSKYSIESGPVAFAVLVPGTSDPMQLRAIGERLRDWKASNPKVGEITALEQMLAGQLPQTSSCEMGLSSPPDNETASVICVDVTIANPATAMELNSWLHNCAIGMLVSLQYYQVIMN